MMHAYNQYYIEDVMNNLAAMFDCAANVVHYDISVFYEMFLASGVATQIEMGNPRYLSGLSGIELMQIVFKKCSDKDIQNIDYHPFERTPEYWAGWALAYYQWYTAKSFSYIRRNGLDIRTLISLYSTLHEADLSKLVETADTIIERHIAESHSILKALRKRLHITQSRLAELSGVSLRMIQAYEQGDQDIRKAEAQTVFALSKALGCKAEVILG